MKKLSTVFFLVLLTACAVRQEMSPEAVAELKTRQLCYTNLGYQVGSTKYKNCYEKNYVAMYQTVLQQRAGRDQAISDAYGAASRSMPHTTTCSTIGNSTSCSTY